MALLDTHYPLGQHNTFRFEATARYAAHVRNSKFTCLSETIGMTCINLVEAEGFFVHRGEYVIFNAG